MIGTGSSFVPGSTFDVYNASYQQLRAGIPATTSGDNGTATMVVPGDLVGTLNASGLVVAINSPCGAGWATSPLVR